MLGTALYLADPELFQNDESSVIMSILCIFVESLHVIAVVYASRYMLMRLQEGSCHPKSLFCMYLTNVLMFGGAHLCLFVASGTRSHQISGLDLTSDSTAAFKNVVDVFISFYYYAVVIMTSTGFGDMIPLTW